MLPLGLLRQARKIISLNLLLVCVPLGFIASASSWSPIAIFLYNFLAIIPLSGLISDASDTLSERWGGMLGGLVNASLGNTVELIVGLLAITQNNVSAAQSVMMGSILNDILLVQGICIIVGARSKGVIVVNSALVDSLSSLMLVASMAMVLPTALYAAIPNPDSKGSGMRQRIVSFSRATSIVLLLIYVAYLYFQHKTHRSLFDDQEDDDDSDATQSSDHLIPTPSPSQDVAARDCESGADLDNIPSMRDVSVIILTLVLSSLAIGGCTYNIMQRLGDIVKAFRVSQTFIALVIIPLASNASEMTQVLAAAKKQKIDFAIAVIVGSILQIALFVLPALVIIGWFIGSKMDLYFEMSQTCVLLFAVILVNQVLQDRQYTYLHGMMFLCLDGLSS
ncbi:Calcium proton exchanger superfamily [Cordyceps militaris]|uniref:Vacuolar calcium ion transporter n=1 Tax=Cordyceps militaris TaxID=73501 RepID=A0A2H4SLT5_CORMI|nr:Calcium proton exchanger superfamily [Cordyceps militaris]